VKTLEQAPRSDAKHITIDAAWKIPATLSNPATTGNKVISINPLVGTNSFGAEPILTLCFLESLKPN
jgi:hypothetical protein